MSVLDEMQDIIWTSPKGTSFTIKTLETEYSQKHIGEVKENPRTSINTKGSSNNENVSVSTSSSVKRVGDSNDTFTDMGISGRDLTLDCYFIGSNHSTQAKAFRKALCEIGKSKLQLAYEDEFTVNVINFSVKNSLVEKVNSTIISVNFHETSPSVYPKSQKSKQKAIKSKVAQAKENLVQTVEDTANNIQSPSRLTTFSAKFQSALTKISSALDTASNASLNSIMSDVMSQDLISNAFTVTSQIGVIFTKAANLVNKTKNLDDPFDLSSSGSSLFGSWQTLIASLKTSSLSGGDSYSSEQNDELRLNDSIASSAIASVAESLINTDFETRADAVEAAKNLVDLSDSWNDFVDEQTPKITELDDAYIRDDSVSEIVSTVANEIIEKSSSLKVEQIITLAENKTPIELAWEYYKDDFRKNPDSTLDYLIRTNKLKDEEFFLIPRGREVKIYV